MLLLLILFTCSLVDSSPTCGGVSDSQRIECTADRPSDQSACLARGCCWQPTQTRGAPACFLPEDYVGYQVVDIVDDWNKVTVNLQRKGSSGFVDDVKNVRLEATFLTDHSLRLRLVDADRQRFEIPFPRLDLPNFPHAFDPTYGLTVDKTGKLVVKRKQTGTVIFATDLTKLTYSDQFIQLSHSVASNSVYGLGEHKAPLKKPMNWSRYELWNHDHPPVEDMNMYGSHPFYLSVEDSEGNSNGVLLFNANAMDVILQPAPAVTWRTIGGVLDYFVFLGPRPGDVVREYVSLIGKPAMPPFWSLGFHLCRCCPMPHTIDDQKKITQRMIDAKIPFDVQWSAKEFFNNNFDMFTINNTRYPGFKQYIEDLQAKGMHWIPIVDPGVGVWPKGQYPPYDEGMEQDIFVKNASGKVLYGDVWNINGKTVFPDFSHPKGIRYWIKQLATYHNVVPFDGLWNDMNEISNLKANGSLDGCPNSRLEHPQYLPGNRPLQLISLCMTAQQYAGIQYNLHNLYALYEALATNLALREIRKKRPFIISRATFIGQGRYSGHWDGDDFATFDQMKWTIPSMINFNMFGIPMVGADICAFQGQAQNDSHFIELCARWHEVGAFYPFSRNHNSKRIDQDPVALGPVVTTATRNALNIRYSLLPLLYTLFYQSEARAEAVVRPLFFEFPSDQNTYQTETQFMWGSSLMVMPVVVEGQRHVDAYFPAGRWYLYDVDYSIRPLDSEGETVALQAPVDKINVAIRGGSVVPSLPPKTTTTETRKQSFVILVALDGQGKAEGELYWDDGDSIDPIQRGVFTTVKFYVKNGSLRIHPTKIGCDEKLPLGAVKVLGLKKKPLLVSVNGKSVDNTYDFESQVLTVPNIGLDMRSTVEVNWK